ncbi:hypothetical protein FQN50_009021 [Emmonsiellopsis sp. PD_5]|nr:hypothetical protein FQN50_009021 [Emmonsiellopsis sp. PD_5]
MVPNPSSSSTPDPRDPGVTGTSDDDTCTTNISQPKPQHNPPPKNNNNDDDNDDDNDASNNNPTTSSKSPQTNPLASSLLPLLTRNPHPLPKTTATTATTVTTVTTATTTPAAPSAPTSNAATIANGVDRLRDHGRSVTVATARSVRRSGGRRGGGG